MTDTEYQAFVKGQHEYTGPSIHWSELRDGGVLVFKNDYVIGMYETEAEFLRYYQWL